MRSVVQQNKPKQSSQGPDTRLPLLLYTKPNKIADFVWKHVAYSQSLKSFYCKTCFVPFQQQKISSPLINRHLRIHDIPYDHVFDQIPLQLQRRIFYFQNNVGVPPHSDQLSRDNKKVVIEKYIRELQTKGLVTKFQAINQLMTLFGASEKKSKQYLRRFKFNPYAKLQKSIKKSRVEISEQSESESKQGSYCFWSNTMKQNCIKWGDFVQIYVQKVGLGYEEVVCFVMGYSNMNLQVCLGVILARKSSQVQPSIQHYFQKTRKILDTPLYLYIHINNNTGVQFSSLQNFANALNNMRRTIEGRYKYSTFTDVTRTTTTYCFTTNHQSYVSTTDFSHGVDYRVQPSNSFVNQIVSVCQCQGQNILQKIFFKLERREQRVRKFSKQHIKFPHFIRSTLLAGCRYAKHGTKSKQLQIWKLVCYDEQLIRLSFLMSKSAFTILLKQYEESVIRLKLKESKSCPGQVIITTINSNNLPEWAAEEKGNSLFDDSIFDQPPSKWTLTYNLKSCHWQCECLMLNNVGIPCSHTIKAIRQYGGWMEYYINTRWIINKDRDQLISEMKYMVNVMQQYMSYC